MAQFSKYTDKDFESRNQHIVTEKTFSSRISGQSYVALNIANVARRPFSKQPGFRIIGVCHTLDEAVEALSDSRTEGCDGLIRQLHTPILLSFLSETETPEIVKIQDVLDETQSSYVYQKNKIEERVRHSKSYIKNSDVDEEIKKLEELAPQIETERSIQTTKNLDTEAIVISVIGIDKPEPVLIVYGLFKTFEDARIYTINHLSSVCEHDVSIVANREWHFVSDFDIKNTKLDDVDYFDQGLSAINEYPKKGFLQNSRD